LQFIVDELNSFLGAKDPAYRGAAAAVLSDLVDQQGELVVARNNDEETHDNVVVTLINVEEETVGKSQVPHVRRPDRTINLLNPDIRINLFVLFSAYSNSAANERYFNCLRLISYVVRFFQSHPVFHHQEFPHLGQEVEKLVVELVSPTFEQQNHLWGALGAKYMPSVLYKVRMLVIREEEESPIAGLVEEIQTSAFHKG
jgi:hypothetical protein